jgi:hypothetical protein
VTLTVASGTYKESWGIFPIAGTSATNTVTFRAFSPLSVRLQPSIRQTVRLVDATSQFPLQHVILDGFDFIPGTTSTSYAPIWGGANCDFIEIKNCRFQAFAAAPSLLHITGSGGVYASNWRIHHNEFRVIDIFRGLNIYYPTNFEVYQNTFVLKRCIAGLTILSRTDNSIRVYNNVFSGKVADRDPTYGAIVMTSNSDGIEITHNTVLI